MKRNHHQRIRKTWNGWSVKLPLKFSCWYTLVYVVQGFEMQVEYVKVEVEQIQTTPLCTDTEYK